jgi:hypothetical protein
VAGTADDFRRIDGSYDFYGVGRLTRTPAIRIGVVEGGYRALNESFGDVDRAVLAQEVVDPDELADANSLLAEFGLDPARLEVTDVGRGASGAGLIIEFAEAIAVVGGVTEAVLRTAQLVRAIHRKLSRRQGHAATISLGAAEFLAAAHLADLVGAHEIKRVVGSGDVRRSAFDASFVGGDAYWIILEAGERLHHYQIDAFERVTYVGDAPLIPDHFDDPPPPPNG